MMSGRKCTSWDEDSNLVENEAGEAKYVNQFELGRKFRNAEAYDLANKFNDRLGKILRDDPPSIENAEAYWVLIREVGCVLHGLEEYILENTKMSQKMRLKMIAGRLGRKNGKR